MKTKIPVLFWLICFVILLNSCADEQSPFDAKKGKIDLSEQKLEGNYHFNIDGEWEFYWNQLIEPQDITKYTPTYITVPSSWAQQTNEKGEKYPADGYATYYLSVKLPKKIRAIDVKIPPIWTAGRVWINEEEVIRNNLIAPSDSSIQGVIGKSITVQVPENHIIKITTQARNQAFFIAGLVEGFEIGAEGELIRQKSLTNTRQLMWLGVLLMMSLYHFILYFFRKTNKSTLYFGIICFLIGARFTIFGQHYIYEYLHQYYPYFMYLIQVKTYYMANALLVPFGLLYLHQLYPKESTLKIGKFLYKILKNIGLQSFAEHHEVRLQNALFLHIPVVISVIYCLIGVFLPLGVFLMTIPIQVAILGFALYIVIILVKAFLKKRNESRLQIAGIFTMIFAGLNDALHTIGVEIVGELEFMPLAFGIFLSLQFLIIAKRFSRAFSEVEDLSENLERKVIVRTAEVTQQKEELEIQGEQLLEQNIELEKTNKHITDSVRYARRIQQAVIGNEDTISKQFCEAFVMLLPKDIVSGDFYFYAQKDDIQVLIAADCTGHGVPGAFMTIMGYNFLEEIITYGNVTDPAEILYELNRKVTLSLQKDDRKSASDGMDASVLAINTKAQTVQFAGAKNPLYRVCNNGEIHQYKGSRSTVGGSVRLRDKKHFETTSIKYESNECFYIFTDGFQDQFGGDQGRKYLTANYRKFLLSISDLPMQKQKRKLKKELQKWQGYRTQTDDILVIGIRL